MTQLTAEQITAYKSLVPSTIEHEPMAKHTSFRVGGSARLYVVAPSSDALLRAVDAAIETGVPWCVYGGGSNLLVADEGYEGVVVQAANRRITHSAQRTSSKLSVEDVTSEAGAITAMVARQSVDAGLTGFEWAIGVPGTVGGAVYGNAGCYGGEMKDVVVSVDAYRIKDRARVTIPNAECGFGYRTSMFKHEPHVILSCDLQLAMTQDVTAGKARMAEIMQKRKASQPLEQSSAGCVFKNFEISDPSALEILSRSVEIPEAMKASGKISVGWLIDQAGMRGKSVGDVEVSMKHGNFFVNKGKARAQDVLALISLVKMKVRDDLGIEMQEEVQLLGF